MNKLALTSQQKSAKKTYSVNGSLDLPLTTYLPIYLILRFFMIGKSDKFQNAILRNKITIEILQVMTISSNHPLLETVSLNEYSIPTKSASTSSPSDLVEFIFERTLLRSFWFMWGWERAIRCPPPPKYNKGGITTVADPGFPRWGTTPEFRIKTYDVASFFPKTMNLKDIDPPPVPANAQLKWSWYWLSRQQQLQRRGVNDTSRTRVTAQWSTLIRINKHRTS